MSITCNMFQNL